MGRGQKICPKCSVPTGPRAKKCKCGYAYTFTPKFLRPKKGLPIDDWQTLRKGDLIKVIKAIKDGNTKAEAAQLYGLNIGTVYNLTRELGINGYRTQGNHIVRKNGIKLLNRLMTDGYLISDFNVPVVRNLQEKFPVIRSARYKDKAFFYLP